MGFEPTTPTLARLCSTPELHPHPIESDHPQGAIEGHLMAERSAECKLVGWGHDWTRLALARRPAMDWEFIEIRAPEVRRRGSGARVADGLRHSPKNFLFTSLEPFRARRDQGCRDAWSVSEHLRKRQ